MKISIKFGIMNYVYFLSSFFFTLNFENLIEFAMNFAN